ncbi:inositol monophosphatase family protein [Profundibacterium mesophilum]|uniref:Myo-inositol-1-monophosphatase n=1 Tax=Profundibacterium mesophilum KAUST100406-0324 TaxID=1037889 RepID=A0A921TCB1_9RHOB|nr:3'(2'),5'-bisphosphate nucleotidase CysQ [Profundibacterium mesophilum]KAF0675478.1 myo-inositol-1-monophosphatase [Profundibacterium mesophilum KAUST100406-0324]
MPATDLPLLIDAVLAAAEIARKHWRSDPQVWGKADKSPVSEADLAVDTHLRKTLIGARPSYGWLSEESADSAERLAAEHCFILDPIDGTRAFVAGQTEWCHSLAVCEGGQITAAVIYLPIEDKLYSAARGQGAMLNGRPIGVSEAGDPHAARILASGPTLSSRSWRGAVPGIDRDYCPPMAYRLALVAEGRYDAMVTLRPAWEWDVAAGALIVAEAGGLVTDRHGAPQRFNSPGRRTDGMLAAPWSLHERLRGELA